MSKKRNNSDNDDKDVNKRRKDNNGHIIIIHKPNDHIIFDSSSSDDEKSASPDIRSEDDTLIEECPGFYCDHMLQSDNVMTPPILTKPITLPQLIELGKCYHCKKQKEIKNLCLYKLALMVPSLIRLNNMVGMKEIKQTFAEQIVYFLMELEQNPKELLHTIIKGPPGVGKSHVIDIIANIYSNMGFLNKKAVTKVKLTDLKAGYVGQTALKTQKAIDSALGGVLVIDEAYSLGTDGDIDSFSKEIIDILNQNLTEKCGEFVCIIAGYGDQLETCLFNHNPGLKSRFRFTFNIAGYNHSELAEMFYAKINIQNLVISDKYKSKISNFFIDNHKQFISYGRDIDSFIFHVKISHSIRVFTSFNSSKIGKINYQDIKNGFERFIQHNDIVKKDTSPMSHLYL